MLQETGISRKPVEQLLPECLTKPLQPLFFTGPNIQHDLLVAPALPVVIGLLDLRLLFFGPCKLLRQAIKLGENNFKAWRRQALACAKINKLQSHLEPQTVWESRDQCLVAWLMASMEESFCESSGRK
ncbi:hypothetical protein PIB30_075898 [Stylosanthes scabra]|uniref:Uncharacterized protein n=1 Tax=Stylosanthes scabra TaxID=79078 RepID=A0ABU6RQN6_9FABA|nr:hypothetical protein [Stylosanthes scabra]